MIYGLDIGGSAVKTGILNEDGEILAKGTFEIAEDFEGMIQNILQDLSVWKERYDINGIAISSPGSVDRETGIIHGASAIPYIHGPNWKVILQEATGYPIAIENDANCAALAEAYYGAGKDADNMAFVVIGTGIGGALIYDKKVIHGNHLHGGEIGYTIIGEREHHFISFSDAASVGALVGNCKSRGLDVKNGIEVFEQAEHGNTIAQEEIQLFYHYLAVGIFNLQYTYDPDVILLSGAISSRKDLVEKVNNEIKEIMKVHDAASLTPSIGLATFKNDSNLIGAYVNYKMS